MSSLGGLAAVFLGVVYAYGAMLKATALNGADVVVADTLPLVPIEQLLLMGVKGSIQFGVTVFAAVLVLVVTTSWEDTRPSDEGGGSSEGGSSSTIGAILLWAFLICGYVAGFLVFPIPAMLSLGAIYGLGWLLSQGRLGLRSYVVAVVLSFTLANVAYEYFDPDPLPRIHLQTTTGSVRGELIATSDGTWWLATGRDLYRGIPAAEVVASDLRSPRHSTKSVLDLLTASP